MFENLRAGGNAKIGRDLSNEGEKGWRRRNYEFWKRDFRLILKVDSVKVTKYEDEDDGFNVALQAIGGFEL